MVVSKLDSTINYIELRTLNSEDAELNVSVFALEILDTPVFIAVGGQKYTFIEKGIIYLPVYLVYDNAVVGQIGVFEFMASQLPDLMSDEDDEEIDILELAEPLVYSFITQAYLEKYKSDSSYTSDDSYSVGEDASDLSSIEDEVLDEVLDEDEVDGDTKVDKDTPSDVKTLMSAISDLELPDESLEEFQDRTKHDDTLPKRTTIIEELFETDPGTTELIPETKQDDETIQQKHSGDSNWVQKMFKNTNFAIEENEGGGDCLFAVIRDAYASIGKKISVADLRNIIASEATQTIFETSKLLYDSYHKELTENAIQIKELEQTYNDIKYKVTGKHTTSSQKIGRDRKKELIVLSKQIHSEWKRLKEQRQFTKQMLSEYEYMKSVNTLDDFRAILKTRKFWGETWSISTIERVLNVKIILLSSESYRANDIKNVMQCGHLNDEILEKRSIFAPKYYIMMDFMGWHFKSLLYKGKKMLRFEEIPYAVRKLIIDKCLERSSGPYSLIPKFMEEKKRIEADEVEHIGETVAELEEDMSSEKTKQDTDAQYDDSIVFQFYRKSADKMPGKGSGERIPESKRGEYTKLAAIQDWRRLLSNHADTPFELDGYKWMSVEHYYQASKFKTKHHEFYTEFSLGSKTDLGKVLSLHPEMAKAAGSDSGKFNGKLIRPKSISVDDAFDIVRAEETMDAALRAKFTQHKNAKQALIETNRAKLMVYVHKQPAMTFYNLMKIRHEM